MIFTQIENKYMLKILLNSLLVQGLGGCYIWFKRDINLPTPEIYRSDNNKINFQMT